MNLGNDFDINLALTDMEQYILDTNPFLDPLSPVYVKDAPEEVFMQSPLFRQVHRLLHIVAEAAGTIYKVSNNFSKFGDNTTVSHRCSFSKIPYGFLRHRWPNYSRPQSRT